MARERKFLMGQPPRTEHIQRIDAQGRGLFVRCDWSVDRYQHQIGWLIAGVEHAALESCEGTPDDQWPPSPPMQQFSIQMIDGNPALLGVGMAGRGHWSASFVLRQKEFVELVVELACFLPAAPNDPSPLIRIPLSTYRVDKTCRIGNYAAGCEPHSFRLQKQGLSDLNVNWLPGSRHGRISGNEDCLLVFEPEQIDSNTATQWSYQIGVAI